MSWELGGKVLEDRGIKDARLFCVMLCLADATNKETGTCYPSLDRIATVARTSRRTAIRSMEKLEALGWIEVIRRRDENGGSLANVYRIVKYSDRSATMSPPGVTHGHSGECQTTGGGGAKSTKRECHHDTPGGVTMAPKPVRVEPVREPVRVCVPDFSLESGPTESIKSRQKITPVSESPPSVQEFVAHAKLKDGDPRKALKQYEIWSESNWIDGKGNRIFGWKGKLTLFIEKKWGAFTEQEDRQGSYSARVQEHQFNCLIESAEDCAAAEERR